MKTKKKTLNYSSSLEKIASNEDLLREILLRLPVKSLMRFKSVSKRWLSLISDTHFCHRRNPLPTSASGLFLRGLGGYHFIPFTDDNSNNNNNNHYNNLTRFPIPIGDDDDDGSFLSIVQSCNGLLCCRVQTKQFTVLDYYVYNPTTKQFTVLPRLSTNHHGGVCLAFDPSKSPHYKAVCVSKVYEKRYQIEIYSSEEGGSWRISGDPFSENRDLTCLDAGVYCNGAIYWLLSHSLYCFIVDVEHFRDLPRPPILDGPNWRYAGYLGESRGHLHLVEIGHPPPKHYVYEMDKESSGWFLKYCVDLEPIFAMLRPGCTGPLDAFHFLLYHGRIVSLVREETEEDSFLVYYVPKMAIYYNIKGKSARKLCDLPSFVHIERSDVRQYIESLASV